MSAPIVFVDTETTGLEVERHEVWDIALIEEDGTEHEWHLKPLNLSAASPEALRITRFYERADSWTPPFPQPTAWSARDQTAWEIGLLTSGKHLVGAVPSFDADFLTKFLLANGHAPAWHYHLIDVETLVAGRLGLEPPWDTAEMSKSTGINSFAKAYEKHTAIGDARWARAMYYGLDMYLEP